MIRSRKMLITTVAVITLAILSFVIPASAKATTSGGQKHASIKHPTRTANVNLGRIKAASSDVVPEQQGCIGHVTVAPSGTWSTVTATASPFGWSYRAVGYFTIFFAGGGSTSGAGVTNSISNDYLCGPGEL